ncbi:MAG: hypothetical protein QXS21_00295 [Thermoproteota archaeon]|nr:hypothetical protein [Candidatus Brockarchaeota archaeon]MBO3768606.1 hypothetical protein [Candidatus Brockarchaeota archaeon]MBO3800902.1 hypothetical protein [Candidatus Brockarchaeota archaeon]
MNSETIECAICKDRILKSEAVFFNGKYYCSHCFRNYVVEAPPTGNIFFVSSIACIISSILSLLRGFTVIFSYFVTRLVSSTLWSKESISFLTNVFLLIGVVSFIMSFAFFISGKYLFNAKNIKGRKYGSISVKIDLALIFIFVLLVWMLQSSGIAQNSFTLYYLIAAVPNTISDSFLLVVLPTLGDVEFSVRS